MGSLARKIKRKQLRNTFDKFKQDWRFEKLAQETILESGKSLPKGHNRLGKAPTLRQFSNFLKNVKPVQTQQKVEQEPQPEIKDLEWEDEG